MLENLKSLIVSELKMLEKEIYENREENLKKEMSAVLEETNKIKYNYCGKNKFKVFIFDLLNHGFTSQHFNLFSFLTFMLTMISCIGWVMFYIINSTLYILPKSSTPVEILISGQSQNLCLFSIVSLLSIVLIVLIYTYSRISSNMYNKIKEYRELENIEIEINKAKELYIVKIKDIGFLFEKEKELSYSFNYPISKEIIAETINILSEESVKYLIRSGNGNFIRYQDLIIKIKEVEEEEGLSEIYNKMKKNNN